ncbi:MAG: MFS transporter [Mycobacteriales bacterium]|nr:MAG: MFS transporter [Pseudonocardiales bacterium]
MSALRDPRFRRLLAGQGFSSFGDSALYLSLGIWMKDLTGSNGAAGAVFLALGLPSLLAPLSGHLVDRVSRRGLIMATNASTALVVLCLLFVHDRHDVWIIYAVAAAYGLAFNVVGAAGAGLFKDMLADADLASANALRQTVFQGLRVVSPLFGAGLYAATGPAPLIVFDAVSFAAAIVAVWSVRVEESPVEHEPAIALRRRLAAGSAHLWRTPLLRSITIAGAVTMLVLGFYESIVFAVVDALNRPPSYLGVLMSVQAVGSIAGGLLAAKAVSRFGEKTVVALGLACFAAGFTVLLGKALPLVFLGVILDGAALMLFAIASATAIQRFTPARLQGRVSSASYVLSDVPQTASIAVGAALIGVVDYRLLLVVMAVVIGFAAAWVLGSGRRETGTAAGRPAVLPADGGGSHYSQIAVLPAAQESPCPNPSPSAAVPPCAPARASAPSEPSAR